MVMIMNKKTTFIVVIILQLQLLLLLSEGNSVTAFSTTSTTSSGSRNHHIPLGLLSSSSSSHRHRRSSCHHDITPTTGSTSTSTTLFTKQRYITRLYATNDNDKENDDDSTTRKTMNPFTKATWYATELFGNTFGRPTNGSTSDDDSSSSSSSSTNTLELPPTSIQETIQRIQEDMKRSYFLNGIVDQEIYDLQCIFADPFVSFQGRERFITNLQNLGSFITNYSVKPMKENVLEENETGEQPPNNPMVQTKVMVKLELNLPWKPVLAWPWGVTYTIDPNTYLIVKHEESWDIEPLEGVKQIFRKPTVKV